MLNHKQGDPGSLRVMAQTDALAAAIEELANTPHGTRAAELIAEIEKEVERILPTEERQAVRMYGAGLPGGAVEGFRLAMRAAGRRVVRRLELAAVGI